MNSPPSAQKSTRVSPPLPDTPPPHARVARAPSSFSNWRKSKIGKAAPETLSNGENSRLHRSCCLLARGVQCARNRGGMSSVTTHLGIDWSFDESSERHPNEVRGPARKCLFKKGIGSKFAPLCSNEIEYMSALGVSQAFICCASF